MNLCFDANGKRMDPVDFSKPLYETITSAVVPGNGVNRRQVGGFGILTGSGFVV